MVSARRRRTNPDFDPLPIQARWAGLFAVLGLIVQLILELAF